MDLPKFFISVFILLAMQLSAATGFTVLLDEAGLIHSQWYHVIIGFMLFNISLAVFLWLNDATVSISQHLRPDAKAQSRTNRQLQRYMA